MEDFMNTLEVETVLEEASGMSSRIQLSKEPWHGFLKRVTSWSMPQGEAAKTGICCPPRSPLAPPGNRWKRRLYAGLRNLNVPVQHWEDRVKESRHKMHPRAQIRDSKEESRVSDLPPWILAVPRTWMRKTIPSRLSLTEKGLALLLWIRQQITVVLTVPVTLK